MLKSSSVLFRETTGPDWFCGNSGYRQTAVCTVTWPINRTISFIWTRSVSIYLLYYIYDKALARFAANIPYVAGIGYGMRIVPYGGGKGKGVKMIIKDFGWPYFCYHTSLQCSFTVLLWHHNIVWFHTDGFILHRTSTTLQHTAYSMSCRTSP